MRIFISGICGFVGSTVALQLRETREGAELCGIDNFARPGSELNRTALRNAGIRVGHADLRNASDLEALPAADWVIDAAASPSVLAGVDGAVSSRQVVENNLGGTINLLEYCKRHRAGCILLSTSRVYSIPPLRELKVKEVAGAYRPVTEQSFPSGITAAGISENCSTSPPISLYGSTKLGSECLALEYGEAFDFPVWVNRCGVLAGAGQFGRADQGIFSFWIHSWRQGAPLIYIGFDGKGSQVRDCLHPRDLVPVLDRQMNTRTAANRICNVAGGIHNSSSLAQLSDWCAARFGPREVGADPTPRVYDVPWLVLDSARAQREWHWQPATPLEQIFEEIAAHAEAHPDWLKLSSL